MIGIIGAMDEEVEQIVAVMDIEREETKAQMTFKAGKLDFCQRYYEWQGSCSCKKWYRKSQHGNLRTDSD